MWNKTSRKTPALAAALLAALTSGVVVTVVAPRTALAEEAAVVVGAAEIAGTSDTATVRLRASREPTFTVFRLEAPSRIVVDLARADVSALQKAGRLDGKGPVLGLTATQFDDPRARVGRVVLAVKDGTKYDVHVQGTDLVVELRAAGAAPTPVARTEAPAAVTPVTAEATQAPAARADDKVVRVEVDALPEGSASGAKLVSASLDAKGSLGVLKLEADGPIGRYEIMELREPGRLALDLSGFTGAPKVSRSAAGPVTALRIGQHEGHVRVVLEAKGPRFPAFEIVRTAKGLAVTVGVTPKAEPTKVDPIVMKESAPAPVAAIPAPAPAPEKSELRLEAAPAKAEKVAVAAQPEVRTLDVSGKGRQTRVVLALTAEVRPEEEAVNGLVHALILPGTRLPHELARKLDASALEGPVASVASYPLDEASGPAVRLVVTLREGEQGADARLQLAKVGPSTGLIWTFTGTQPRRLALASLDRSTQPGGFLGEAPAYAMNAGPRAGDTSQYTGKRVDFTAKELDIIQFLQAIGEVSKRNIVASDDVMGKVSVRLRNVPWDEALDIVLRTKGFAKEEVGNIIRVAKLETLRKEAEAKAADEKSAVDTEKLKVRIIPVNYAEAKGIADRVKDLLSPRGTVSVDDRTNVLIVKDVVDVLAKSELLVRNLDTQTPQVLIEARIVEAATSFSREVGIQWGGDIGATQTLGNPTGLVFPNIVSVSGAAPSTNSQTNGISSAPNFAVNLPAAIGAGAGGGIGFIFGSAGGAANLNLRLSAAEVNGTIKLVSSPKVTTLDNQAATISQGISIPFSQTSAAGVNTTFIQAELSLAVTPHVTSDGSILLNIKASNNQPNPQLTGANGQPSISRREAATRVLVKDGDTTVMGGIYTRRNSVTANGVPFLAHLPIIGRFFSKQSETDDRTEMLIFITPKIVNRQQSTVTAGEAQ